jgi:hypothetical protein
MYTLPFYGFRGVSGIPGMAAFEHKLMISGPGVPILSNAFVFIYSIMLFYVGIWWTAIFKIPALFEKPIRILPVALIEAGKWEFLLFFYERTVKSALYGFWVNSFINAALLLFLLFYRQRKPPKT